MANLGMPPSNRFRHLEDARGFALKQPGNERILKQGAEFVVEALPELEGQNNHLPNLLDLRGDQILPQLQSQLTASAAGSTEGSATTVVEFLLDTSNDGELLPDRRFVVDKGEIKESNYRLNGLSEALRSPEARALEILREAIQKNQTGPLLRLSPNLT
ncbi:MAG: hypothetical protein CVV27_12980, partial [Candidatus Melainabacteria bacterium HGW-Melainabacteria-1]